MPSVHIKAKIAERESSTNIAMCVTYNTMWNGLPEDLRSTTFFKGFSIQSGGNFVSANMIIQVMGSFKVLFSYFCMSSYFFSFLLSTSFLLGLLFIFYYFFSCSEILAFTARM